MLDAADEEAAPFAGRPRAHRAARFAAWILSALVHAGILLLLGGGDASWDPRPRSATLRPAADAALARSRAPLAAQRKRHDLIAAARVAAREGRLELGEFLLRANAIDAEAEGEPFDLGGARARYAERLAALRVALASSQPESAAGDVFGDIAYTGTPGGRMGEALLWRRGSCEPVSHLVAAALHDAGLADRARLRFYGAPRSGASHVTPILASSDGGEIDLMTGVAPAAGGAAFPAADLVEVYARVHGFAARPSPVHAPASPSAIGLVDAGAVPATRTMTSGYPPNADRFGGSLPLFAERAIAHGLEGTPAVEEVESRDESPPCSAFVSLAWLDLPSAETLDGGVDIDLVRAPSSFELERIATTIARLEDGRSAESIPARLLDHACLAALYDHAGLKFSLAGQSEVTRRAVLGARREQDGARATLGELAKLGEAERREALRELDRLSMGRAWILLFLEGGEIPVKELTLDTSVRYGRTTALAASIVAPRTREQSVFVADALPMATQIEVMHEVNHAHDFARPWASSYDLDLDAAPSAAATRFARTYRVFRSVAWLLWDAAASPEETVATLAREAARLDLDEPARRAIALYYLKHAFRLYAARKGGDAVLLRVLAALEEHGLPNVAELEAEDDLTPSERRALPSGR